MASAAKGRKAKRAKTDPTEKFGEMFDELYTATGDKRERYTLAGISDNTLRRHKAFFKRNPDLKGEFDAYCEVRRDEAYAVDSRDADIMRHVIDMSKAEEDFRAVYKRGMSAHEVNVVVTALCTKYKYDGTADRELAQKSRDTRRHLKELGALELAFDHCVAQYELAERFSTDGQPPRPVVYTFTRDANTLASRLDNAGFHVNKIFIAAYEVPTGSIFHLRRK